MTFYMVVLPRERPRRLQGLRELVLLFRLIMSFLSIIFCFSHLCCPSSGLSLVSNEILHSLNVGLVSGFLLITFFFVTWPFLPPPPPLAMVRERTVNTDEAIRGLISGVKSMICARALLCVGVQLIYTIRLVGNVNL